MKIIKCKNNWGGFSNIPKDKFFFRPSVYGIIKHNGKVVTVKSKSNGKLWFPGGGIEIGEKIENALKREILEETGLKISIIKPLGFFENFFYYQPEDSASHSFLFFYLCSLTGSDKLINDDQVEDNEAIEPRWVEIKKLSKKNFSNSGERIMEIIYSLTKN